ncbi:MAG: hypothetical protein KatS3mg015_2477 [Fimbriimonadales bacterium]|nr:MAG: hypothetical protein KatS3mg015_2477 [Fimbriimonadales bacterium]
MSRKNGYPTSIWLDEETLEFLDRLRAELGMSRSDIIRFAIRSLEGEDIRKIMRLLSELAQLIGATRWGGPQPAPLPKGKEVASRGGV